MDKTKINDYMYDYGYNSTIEYYYDNSSENGVIGRVVNAQRNVNEVVTSEGIFKCATKGKLLYNQIFPIIGDWVVIDENNQIIDILTRKNVLVRKSNEKKVLKDEMASYIDQVFIVVDANEHSINLINSIVNLVSDLKFAIIINKCDLLDDKQIELLKEQLENAYAYADVYFVSTVNKERFITNLNLFEKGKTYTFIGKSGVGKSSIINQVFNKTIMKTAEVNDKTNEGRHTTTHKQILLHDDGFCLMDIPGVRLFDSWISEGDSLVFEEIIELSKNCKFSDCKHEDEPGCNVVNNVSPTLLEEYRKYNDYQLYLNRNQSTDSMRKYVNNKKEKLKNEWNK